MKSKARIKSMKELEFWAYDKRQKHISLWANGKRKYRYIAKHTCRNKDYKFMEKNLLIYEFLDKNPTPQTN